MGGRIPDNVEERLALPMTADAAQAYADYVALGKDRSLRRLAAQYRERAAASGDKPASNLRQLSAWSADYAWGQRIARHIVAEADGAVTDVARDRMTVYRNCMAELLYRTDPARIREMDTRELVQVVDRVKPPDSEAIAPVRKAYRIVEFAGDPS